MRSGPPRVGLPGARVAFHSIIHSIAARSSSVASAAGAIMVGKASGRPLVAARHAARPWEAQSGGTWPPGPRGPLCTLHLSPLRLSRSLLCCSGARLRDLRRDAPQGQQVHDQGRPAGAPLAPRRPCDRQRAREHAEPAHAGSRGPSVAATLSQPTPAHAALPSRLADQAGSHAEAGVRRGAGATQEQGRLEADPELAQAGAA